MLKWLFGNRTNQQATLSVNYPPLEYYELHMVDDYYQPSEYHESIVVDGRYISTHVTTFRGAVKKIEMHIYDFNVHARLLMDAVIENIDESEKDYQVPFRYAGADPNGKGLVKAFSITELNVIEPKI